MTPANRNKFGTSHQGRAIATDSFGAGKLSVLLLGGVHGDEVEGTLFVEQFQREVESKRIPLPDGITLHICPQANPDGCISVRRTNHHNVDLNRNLPTVDWTGEFTNPRFYPGPAACSEPENTAILAMIEKLRPDLILSLHSYEHPMVNFNGESKDIADAMGTLCGLEAKGDIGYPTPGSLGTYAGWERNIPTITLEILRGQEQSVVWQTHQKGVEAALSFYLNHPLPQRKTPAAH